MLVQQRLQDHTCRNDNLSEVLGSPFHKALAYSLQAKGTGLSDSKSSLSVTLLEVWQSRKYWTSLLSRGERDLADLSKGILDLAVCEMAG